MRCEPLTRQGRLHVAFSRVTFSAICFTRGQRSKVKMPMYELPAIVDQTSPIEMPSCMYRLPPIQGYAMGDINSVSGRLTSNLTFTFDL